MANKSVDLFNLSFAELLKFRLQDNNGFIYKDHLYTWNDIDKCSNVISNDLTKLGVKKGTHVGLCGTNSINWIFTFFAIAKLGGIAVLINPHLRPNELLDICKIGGVSLLCYSEIENVTSFDLYKKACLDNENIKNMYDFSDKIDFSLRSNDDINIPTNDILKSDDPCLIIFTSGSTGKPKAVLLSAYSLMYSLKPIIDNIKHTSEDINLAFLPFFHVFGFESTIVSGLLNGHISIIPSIISSCELISLIDKYKVTLFNTVPTMMLAIINNEEFSPAKLSSLRSTLLGGSSTSKEQMMTFKELLPNNHFSNLYGMSENAVISATSYEDSTEHITETVGKPAANTKVLIKDAKGNTIKNGVGEICIKSDSMLVCYYKLPLNVQPIDDDGYLKTGDLGYIDNDGYIRLTGRIKDLIICSGENISPNEVAQAIYSLNHFADVKVVGIPDNVKGELVAAAIITKPKYTFNREELNKELSNILAKYKIPVYYKIYKSFPLLSTGKIDKVTIVNEITKEYREKV